MADVTYLGQENFGFNTTAGLPNSQSLTVPANTDCIVVGVSGWNASSAFNMGTLNFTSSGSGRTFLTVVRTYYNNNNQTTHCSYVMTPSTTGNDWPGASSTPTLYCDVDGSHTQGFGFVVSYWQNVDASDPIIDSDFADKGTVNGADPYTFATALTGVGASDMGIIGAHDVDNVLDVTGGGQTEIAEGSVYSSAKCAMAYELGEDTMTCTAGTNHSLVQFALRAATAAGANPKNPLGLPIMGCFGGPI